VLHLYFKPYDFFLHVESFLEKFVKYNLSYT